jgi:hypothetical protein
MESRRLSGVGVPVGLPPGSSSLGTTFEFFESERVASRTPGSGETLKSDRITAVEGVAAGGGTRCDTMYIGTNDGMVHRMRVAEEGGSLGYSVEVSFAAMEMERPGGIRETFRIRHIERVGVAGASAGAGAGATTRETVSKTLPKTSTPALKSPNPQKSADTVSFSKQTALDTGRPSTSGRLGSGAAREGPIVQHPSTIGRRLYAVLEDTIRGKQVESADELLVVVGHSRSNIVVSVWGVSAEVLSGDSVPAPSLVAHKSVFKSQKLLESDIESVAVSTSEWPRVLVAAGTSSGAIHVYHCVDIGIEGAGDEFNLLRTVNALKDKCEHAVGNGALKTNRVHHVSFVCPSVPGADPGVWGASENGDVVGFRTKDGGIELLDGVNGPVKRGCVSQDEHGVLSLVTRDGIFCYSMVDGRTVAISLQGGEKQAAFAMADGYLVIVGDEGVRAGQRARGPIGPMRQVRFQVLDLERRIMASSTALSHGPVRVARVRSSMGPLHSSDSPVGPMLHFYVFDGTGRVHRVSEVSFDTQIEELCTANMFLQALGSCEKERARRRVSAVVDDCTARAARVHLLFGDHLCHRGEYEAAVDAYINTIGFVETSHVIKIFLQGSGDVSQLRRYLTELVNRDLATGDHISLLMQMYLDANESSQIDELVNQLCLRRGKLAASLDAATAIKVLRRGGFVQHALDIAESYDKDDEYVSILMDDRLAYDEVLEYLKTRPRVFAEAQLLRHGAELIKNAGSATTRMVMELCTSPKPGSGDEYVADLARFAPLYVNCGKGPQTQDFRHLCEQVILSQREAGAPPGVSANIIYHSLLDAYLRDDQEHDAAGEPIVGDAVVDLLCRGWPPGHEPSYDPDVVLTRCATHGHLRGVAFVLMRLRRYRDAVLTHAAAHEWQLVVDLCIKHGGSSDDDDPSIWRVALESVVAYVAAGSADVDRVAEVHTHLESLLAAIGKAGAMAPLAVLDVLAGSTELPFSVAKHYFVETLQEDLACINASSADISTLTKKIEATERSLEQLDGCPASFKATRDSSTGSNLRMPAIHFMCGHSFNAADLDRQLEGAVNLLPSPPTTTTTMATMTTAGVVPACPLCAEDQERVRDLLRNSKVTTRARDAFFRRLQKSDDGFLEIGQRRPRI